MPAVALTDRANLFGALEFSQYAQGRRACSRSSAAPCRSTGIGERPPERWARTPDRRAAGPERDRLAQPDGPVVHGLPRQRGHGRAGGALGRGGGALRGADPAVGRAGRAGRSAVRRRQGGRGRARPWTRCARCSATASTSSCSATALPAEAAAEPGLVALGLRQRRAAGRHQRRLFRQAGHAHGPRRAAVRRRRRLPEPGGAPPGHGRALVQAGRGHARRSSPTCRRPATPPSTSPGAAPSWSRSATRSCRASPPAPAAPRPRSWPTRRARG